MAENWGPAGEIADPVPGAAYDRLRVAYDAAIANSAQTVARLSVALDDVYDGLLALDPGETPSHIGRVVDYLCHLIRNARGDDAPA